MTGGTYRVGAHRGEPSYLCYNENVEAERGRHSEPDRLVFCTGGLGPESWPQSVAGATQLREAVSHSGDGEEPALAGGSRGCASLPTLVGGGAPAELATPGPWQGSAPTWAGPHPGSKGLSRRSLLMVIVLGH